MKYLRTYESLFDIVKPYLNKYVVYKEDRDNNHYLLRIKEKMIDDYLVTDRLFTLKKDKEIKKNKKHSHYTLNINKLNNIIYHSDNLIDAYKVLNSINNSNLYNL